MGWLVLNWGGLKLRKLFINNWFHVSSGLVSGGGGIVVGCWNSITCLGGILLGCSSAEKWRDHWKNNFFRNNSVVLSMWDRPIETVKNIWVNIWCIFDWILSQNCRNTLSLHHTVDQLARSAKTWKLFCLPYYLQPRPLLIRWKNIKIQVWLWFSIVWTVFNKTITWHLHHNICCLGEP